MTITVDTDNRLAIGEIVKLQNLSRPDLNGRFGIVQSFVNDTGRYEVVSIDGHGNRRLALKPENLTQQGIIKPADPDFSSERRFQHVVFWPRPKGSTNAIPVQAFDDWPPSHYDEEVFLMEKLHWKDPQVLGGVESRGVAKPDFMMYFDAGNTHAPINMAAKMILANLPDYELSKLGLESSHSTTPRGACVLVYSPMKMSTPQSFGIPGQDDVPTEMMTAGNPDRLFSLQQLLGTLSFQMSPEGRQQYEEHDDPMHRMFGGMF